MRRAAACAAVAILLVPSVTGCGILADVGTVLAPTQTSAVPRGCGVMTTADVPWTTTTTTGRGHGLMPRMSTEPQRRWTINTNVDGMNEFVATATTVLFDLPFCDGHTVFAVDADSGAQRWTHRVPRDTGECALARSGRALCWDAKSTKPRESGATLVFLGPDAKPRFIAIREPGEVVIAATADGGFLVGVEGWDRGSALYSFTGTGEMRWRTAVASALTGIDVAGAMVVVSSTLEGTADRIYRLADGGEVIDGAVLSLDAGTASIQFNSDGFTVSGTAGPTPWTFFFDRDGRRRAAAPFWRHVQRSDVSARCDRVILEASSGSTIAAVDPASAVVRWEQPAPIAGTDDRTAVYACLGQTLTVGHRYPEVMRSLESGEVLRAFDRAVVEVMGTDGEVVIVSAEVPRNGSGYTQTNLSAYSATTGALMWSLPNDRYTTGRAFPGPGEGIYLTGADSVTRLG